MDFPILLPQDRHRDAGTSKFARQIRPIRLDPSPQAGRDSGAAEELALQRVIGDVVRQGPFQLRRRRPLQVVLDRAARHAQKPADLAHAHPVMVKP